MSRATIGPCACRACLLRKGYVAGWRAFPKWERALYIATVIASAIVFTLLLASCTATGQAFESCEPYHCEDGLEP